MLNEKQPNDGVATSQLPKVFKFKKRNTNDKCSSSDIKAKGVCESVPSTSTAFQNSVANDISMDDTIVWYDDCNQGSPKNGNIYKFTKLHLTFQLLL